MAERSFEPAGKPALHRLLAGIVGDEHVRSDPGGLEPYGRDATPLFHHRPDFVAFPRSTAEVAAVLRVANEHRIPVIPRGAGSNLCAATVPLTGGIVLVLTRMDAILEISSEELLAVCQPGLTTSALGTAAAGHGLLYAPDPGSRTVSTIGGNVATCAGGLRGLKYGVTRNHVLGVEVVLATGEVIRTGGRLWKDVAGYDLTRLLTGSEGTLGVITEVTLALLPMPATSGTGVAYFTTLAEASEAVRRTIAAGVVPATLEFLDNICLNAVEDFAGLGLRRDAGALLLFGDDGTPDAVERAITRMADICASAGALEVTTAEDVAQSEALLAARRCSLPALARLGPMTILEDVSVPRPRMADMVDRIDEIAARHDVRIGTFGHAGDGNLHPTCVLHPADQAAIGRAHTAFGEIFHTAVELGGTITGEHGVGAAKLPYLEARLGNTHIDLLRRIKHAFDPNGILNPGKLGS
ncbi:FAD-binding oxidoreductase [Streptomyces sp. ISL-100]|uniref:FAD-binding oxidoreductase n=1 Tax=Streptomyces sp. ISL-100 TaxID=2819173 RepID=UPI001BE8E6DF|nr:FAD-linked oxidase C-terminal domain-containing protein [Streptomyces sp. ISL-100]MBT2395390.1 FAD-binding protein [Streptomyces sp. ISL-100]